MWFGSISSLKRSFEKQHEKQHEEKMKLIKLLEEQQKTLSEIADALRKMTTQQVKDNFTVKEIIDKVVKEDAAKGLIKEAIDSMKKAIMEDELKELVFKTMKKTVAETVKDMVKETVKIAVSENGKVSVTKVKSLKEKTLEEIQEDYERTGVVPPGYHVNELGFVNKNRNNTYSNPDYWVH